MPIYKLDSKEKLSHFSELISSIKLNYEYSELFWVKEVIAVHDSPGGSNKHILLNKLNELNSLVKIQFIENNTTFGQAFSRNIGAKASTGTYLHFIDQDDKISHDFYFQVSKLYASDIDFFIGDCILLSNSKLSFYKYFTKLWIKKVNSINRLKILFSNNVCNSPGQMLIDANFFWRVGGFPNLVNRGSDDFAFFLRLLHIPHKYRFVENAKLLYRIHLNQSSKILDLSASIAEAFEGLCPAHRTDLQVLEKLKISKTLIILRIFLYKTMFNTFK